MYEDEFPWVEGGAKLSNGFKRHIYIDIRDRDAIKGFRGKYDNTGIYRTAYRYDTPKQSEAKLYGDLYLDFDAESDDMGYEQVKEDAKRAIAFFTAIFGIKPEQLNMYFSGKKGLHITVPARVLAITPDAELNEIFRVIAKDVHTVTTYKTVDTKIYDRVRLFRVINSKHPDTQLYKVPITYEEFSELSYNEIKELAKAPRIIRSEPAEYNMKAARVMKEYGEQWIKEKANLSQNRNGERKLDFTPPCIKHIQEEGAIQGKRNNTAAVLASFYRQRGYDEEKAYRRLSKWNDEVCQPAMPEREIRTVISSIYGTGYTYGCRTLEELSICDAENCKIGQGNKMK